MNQRNRRASYARADVVVAETALAHWRETGHNTQVWFGLDETGNIIDYTDDEPGPGWGCRTCDPDLFEGASA